jgi:hypothetical protein
MRPTTRTPRAVVGAMLLMGATACHPAHLQVVPPPALPDAARVPSQPEIKAEPAEFTPRIEEQAFGDTRLALPRKAVGLAPLRDEGVVTDLHYRLMRAMLESGYRSVIDLSPSQRVIASHASRSAGGDVKLYGLMSDLLRLARVSKAELVVVGDLEQAAAVQRHLPVRFWYDESDLANYQGALDSYGHKRTERLAELETLQREYGAVFDEAMRQYEEAMPWWQRLANMVSTTQEEKDYQVFLDQVEVRERAMPERVPGAEELREQADGMQEKRTVDVLVAKARFQVVDPGNGEVRTVVEVEVEGTNQEELVERLADTAVKALGER